jgi:Orsellinic acid/F9775 biosynthesis cluster protein D
LEKSVSVAGTTKEQVSAVTDLEAQDDDAAFEENAETGTVLMSQLETTSLLDKLGFHYNTISMVLVCKDCKYFVSPKDAVIHSKEHHCSDGIPVAWGPMSRLQTEVEVECTDLDLSFTPPEPLEHGSSVLDGLAVHHDTVQCIRCGYVGLPSSVKAYNKQIRCSMDIPADQRTKPCLSQHFTTNSPYWRVNPNEPIQGSHVISLDTFGTYLEEETVLIPSVENTRDRPPLILHTGWIEHLGQHYATSNGHQQLVSLCEVPKAADALHFACDLVQEYLEEIGKQAKNMHPARLRIFENYPVYAAYPIMHFMYIDTDMELQGVI